MMGLCGFPKAAVPMTLLPLQWFEIANRWEGSQHNNRGGIHEKTHFLIRDCGWKEKTCKSWWAAAIQFLSEQYRQKEKKKSLWQEKLRLKYKQTLQSPAAWLILPVWQDQILFSLWKPTRPSGWRPWIKAQFQGVPCANDLDEIRYLASHLKNIWRIAMRLALQVKTLLTPGPAANVAAELMWIILNWGWTRQVLLL